MRNKKAFNVIRVSLVSNNMSPKNIILICIAEFIKLILWKPPFSGLIV